MRDARFVDFPQQEFNKRQQFKQQMKRLTDEKDEQDREIQIMTEQRDELMREIEGIESTRNKLMAEFYSLKESLTPILTKTVTISDEDKRLGALLNAADDETEPEGVDAAPSGGKSDKKKDKKEKKDKKAEKKDKKDKKEKSGSRSGGVAAIPSPLTSSASHRTTAADADKVLPLSEFPKYVDDFLKVRTCPST
jgi:hypothetical protein